MPSHLTLYSANSLHLSSPSQPLSPQSEQPSLSGKPPSPSSSYQYPFLRSTVNIAKIENAYDSCLESSFAKSTSKPNMNFSGNRNTLSRCPLPQHRLVPPSSQSSKGPFSSECVTWETTCSRVTSEACFKTQISKLALPSLNQNRCGGWVRKGGQNPHLKPAPTAIPQFHTGVTEKGSRKQAEER